VHAVSIAAPYTRAGYRGLLGLLAAAGRSCVTYGAEAAAAAGPCVLLRHDVDIDPGAALALARDEAAAGARATYFVMLRSPAYNAFSRDAAAAFAEIAALGHWIGLHYDASVEPVAGRTHAEQAAVEAGVLAALLGVPVASLSLHQPALAGDQPGRIAPAGLASAWDVEGFAYLSDANKQLAADTLARAVADPAQPRLQLLIHPEWWVGDDAVRSTPDLWDDALGRSFARMQEQFLATERGYGPPRTFVVGRA
jgi:hypothetical protein